ncbi:MAG: hypothetical protein ING90_20660, partial [Rhodocyclaceae bacterium]|nr:hypothetical protein [Rhodocyclaceae bacterium]
MTRDAGASPAAPRSDPRAGGRRLYTLGLWLAAPLVLARLALRLRRQPGYLDHLGERFGRYRSRAAPAVVPSARAAQLERSGPLYWLHAVSVGETQ